MPVIAGELLLYATTDIPANDVDAGGGAIDMANQITDAQQGKIYGTITANPLAGADIIVYGKAHYYNNNGSAEDLTNGLVWLRNGLLNPVATGTVAITTTAVADDNTKKIRIKGRNSVGTPTTEDVTLPAAPGNVFSTVQWLLNFPIRVELRLVADSSLTTAAGDITIARGIDLGIIPEGYGTARGDVDIWLAANLDDATAIANRLTAPAGSAFARSVTEATAQNVANAGTLTAGTDQAIWTKWTLNDGALPASDLELDCHIKGDTA